MKRLGPERQRRSSVDGIDAGFRLNMSIGMLLIWILIVAILFTGERNQIWAYAAVVCGLPFPAAVVFAFLTLRSWLDERSWLRAEEMARNAPPVGGEGRTGE